MAPINCNLEPHVHDTAFEVSCLLINGCPMPVTPLSVGCYWLRVSFDVRFSLLNLANQPKLIE